MSDSGGWRYIGPVQHGKKIVAWFRSGLIVWCAFVAIILLMAAPYIFTAFFKLSPSEFAFRIYGLSLQYLGFLCAIWGINSNLRELGLKTIRNQIAGYFRRFPSARAPKSVQLQAKGLTISGAVGRPRIFSSLDSGAPIEERFNHLESQVKSLFFQISEVEARHKEIEEKSQKHIQEEVKETHQKISQLNSTLVDVLTNGQVLQLFGIWSFVVGITYSTLPDVFANW